MIKFRRGKLRIFLLFLLLVLIIFLAYNYIIEKKIADMKFKDYILRSGINPDMIGSKEIIKDWKMGGQNIFIKYIDDPDYLYIYHYNLRSHKKYQEVKYHDIDLSVIEASFELDEEDYYKLKYPPILD